ncbi:hypothetical protein Dsin_028824 [Dipteronia sinensis]|uniref:Uncharacterized protein n=1 Tax=Dipteronia sinensis TaxID=43782 RepID=A0AAE0DUL8_9ROSI|nr:hypothetical protein Dsin_028824 [Dipteronia sinensis]
MICGLHVAKNAYTHLHKEKKKSPFQSLLFKQLPEDEFEELWNKMLKQHGLKENDWMSRMYEKKHRKSMKMVIGIRKSTIKLYFRVTTICSKSSGVFTKFACVSEDFQEVWNIPEVWIIPGFGQKLGSDSKSSHVFRRISETFMTFCVLVSNRVGFPSLKSTGFEFRLRSMT